MLFKINKPVGCFNVLLSGTKVKSFMPESTRPLIWLENARSSYEQSSLSQHSGMLSLFDSLIRALTMHMLFFLFLSFSNYLLMLFMHLYLARILLHIIRVTIHSSVYTKRSVFFCRATLFSFTAIILKRHYLFLKAVRLN